ncbi:DoxX family protein [Cohnella yongneupensis]|uniref:DoxX family protein n=1 Tax=Cohnella yongneupensis TaxID=425006 RepID=A0ABW0QXF2_9BACL
MNVALWIVQGLLALLFIYSGWLKGIQVDKAQVAWGWVDDVPRGLVGFIGVMELIGAIGLIVPEATGIAPAMTPAAAIGLAVIVLLGALFHVKRKEYKEIGVNVVFLALAVFVAIGRL